MMPTTEREEVATDLGSLAVLASFMANQIAEGVTEFDPSAYAELELRTKDALTGVGSMVKE
jgi:hypothetical protein